MRVLILDDSEIVGGLVSFIIERKGLEPHVFSKGVEALNFLTDEEKPYPDLIITDHYLSKINNVRKTGFMVLKALNKLGKKIPVIVLSAVSDERIVSKYLDMGVVGFVSKDDYDFIDTLEDKVVEVLKDLEDERLRNQVFKAHEKHMKNNMKKSKINVDNEDGFGLTE